MADEPTSGGPYNAAEQEAMAEAERRGYEAGAADMRRAAERVVLSMEVRPEVVEHLASIVAAEVEQQCAVLAEDLRKTKAERDRLLPFVIQKCGNCGAVTAPQSEEEHDCRWRRSMSVGE